MHGHRQKGFSNMDGIKLNSIEEAIEDIRKGKLLIVVDDEDRENEGDFICSAELITPEIVNFMATYGRGLICAALPEERCDELDLDLMVGINTSLHETQFTVSVDLLSNETSTGVSAKDRALTIKALVDPSTKPKDLGRPGHIFPLKAKSKGVLRRAGHTEAVVDLTGMAGLSPGGALVEIMNDDGSMARLPELLKMSNKFGIKIITIKDLITYRLDRDSIIEKRNKIILGLLIYQGLTTEELHQLEPDHLRLKQGKITVPGNRRRNSRILDLKPFQILELHEYINETRLAILSEITTPKPARKPNKLNKTRLKDQLLVSINGSENIKNSLLHLFKAIRKTFPDIQNPKQIRASVIIAWLKTYNLRQVQYFAGHKYISSTERYQLNNLDSLKSKLEKCHPLNTLK